MVCWWRFDFAAFAAPLGLHCVLASRNTGKAIATGLVAFATGAGLLVLSDTRYFGVGVVVAPWRNLVFNASTENLRRFGLHPRWFHVLVNAPFLYGPLLLCLGRFYNANAFGRAIDASAALGVAALSVAPHQEPRFLLPTACALYARAAPRVKNLKWRRSFYVVWLVFHLTITGFYTCVHQAGLIPLLRHVGKEESEACDHVVFVGTYLPPYSVAGPRAGVSLFLHDFENDIDGLGRRVKALHSEIRGEKYGRCKRPRLRIAVAAPALAAARAAFPRLGAEVASFRPHFSGELPPRAFSELALGLYEARF
jgi:phosphatidylinositol glycan class Z